MDYSEEGDEGRMFSRDPTVRRSGNLSSAAHSGDRLWNILQERVVQIIEQRWEEIISKPKLWPLRKAMNVASGAVGKVGVATSGLVFAADTARVMAPLISETMSRILPDNVITNRIKSVLDGWLTDALQRVSANIRAAFSFVPQAMSAATAIGEMGGLPLGVDADVTGAALGRVLVARGQWGMRFSEAALRAQVQGATWGQVDFFKGGATAIGFDWLPNKLTDLFRK